jgi:hypothetical protein
MFFSNYDLHRRGIMKKKVFLITIIVGAFLLIQSLYAQTWNSTKRLTYNSGDSKVPANDVNSNNHIHVVWMDDSPGNWEIFHKKSTNGGTTWTTKRLTYNSGDAWSVDIAINSSNHLHVVWVDDTSDNWEIYHKNSTNSGTNWTTKRLTYNTGSSGAPAISVDSSDNLHVVWNDSSPGNTEIYHKKSTNGGSTWTTKRVTFNSGVSLSPAIAIDSSNNLHVIWFDWTPGQTEIYYSKSTDGGSTWTSKRLTYNPGSSTHPTIAVDSNDNIHIVWDDSTPGTGEIYHKKSTNGGTTWTTKRMTYNSGGSYYPSIAVDSNDNLHTSWHDYTPGNSEIYYKRSTNAGSTWATKRLTFNSGNSDIPTIAIGSDNHIHIVWQDNSPGDYEIYYRKGVQ